MRSVRSVCVKKIFVLFVRFVFKKILECYSCDSCSKKLRYVVYMGRWGHIGDRRNFNVLCLFA